MSRVFYKVSSCLGSKEEASYMTKITDVIVPGPGDNDDDANGEWTIADLWGGVCARGWSERLIGSFRVLANEA